MSDKPETETGIREPTINGLSAEALARYEWIMSAIKRWEAHPTPSDAVYADHAAGFEPPEPGGLGGGE